MLFHAGYKHNRISIVLDERLDELDMFIVAFIVFYILIFYVLFFGREAGFEPATTDLKDRSNFSSQHSREVKFKTSRYVLYR